jgi:hypothetical protein
MPKFDSNIQLGFFAERLKLGHKRQWRFVDAGEISDCSARFTTNYGH